MKKCVVIIPVYKENPLKSELASFKQCLLVLNEHDIVICTYDSLSLNKYNEISLSLNKSYNVEFFDVNYFKSVRGYNELCLNKVFYERFGEYEYMLIYQLDAWVFKDDLLYWCSKQYDYIGAPQFYSNKQFKGIGNGGFSLRKIDYCLKILNKCPFMPYAKPKYEINYYKKAYDALLKKKLLTLFIYLIRIILKSFGHKNSIRYYSSSSNDVNEDIIFSVMAKHAWGIDANIPTYSEAIGFAFECYPSSLFLENNNTLPFGCHAFEKWEYADFWSQYIDIK